MLDFTLKIDFFHLKKKFIDIILIWLDLIKIVTLLTKMKLENL